VEDYDLTRRLSRIDRRVKHALTLIIFNIGLTVLFFVAHMVTR
jgi:hypothetical protein